MIRKYIQKLADYIFTSDNKWTWYDDYFEKKGIKDIEEWKTNRIRLKEEFNSFYEVNKDRFNNIKDLLADNKSKIVYQQIIDYRLTFDWKYHPGKERNQYFPQDIIHLVPTEVFVDCGAYTGDTVQEFFKITNGAYKKIITFEPDPNLGIVIKNNIKGFHDVCFIEKGVSDKKGKEYFYADGSSGGKIQTEVDEKNENIVEIFVDKIDAIEACQDATFIKMDLEGGEWSALHGAEDVIKRNKPVLAICIYHSNEDLLRIIEYVLKIVPEYSVYVRHHSKDATETVAYFVPEDRKGLLDE